MAAKKGPKPARLPAHALLSPSSAHRWLQCPGSVFANANKPWEQSVYALEGTTAHALLEISLRLDTEPENFLGKVIEKGLMPIDDVMVASVGYAIDYLKAYLANNPKAEYHIEDPVFPGPQLGTENHVLWGTPDIRISNYPKESVVIDYKHGVGKPVSVKRNPQLTIYQVGQRQEFGRYHRYRNVVVQPRIPKRKPVQEHTLTDVELVEWMEKEVKPVIPIALSDNAPRKAGEWCHYCAASGTCPAQMRAAFDEAAKDFAGATNPKRLTPAQIAEYLDKLPMVKIAIDALKEQAINAIHAGVDIPGYAKAWTNSRRDWANEEQANAFMAEWGLPKIERFEVKLISPAKAEKALHKLPEYPRKKRGETFVDPLEDLITYREQNPSIEKVKDE